MNIKTNFTNIKKVKYLLGLFIFGFGLLINQTFGKGIIIEAITLPLTSSNFQSVANYRYNFNYSQSTRNGTATSYVRWLGYNLFYNDTVIYDFNHYRGQSVCPEKYTDTLLYSSFFSGSTYTGQCPNFYSRPSWIYSSTNLPDLDWSAGQNYAGQVTIALGVENNFGKNWIFIGDENDTTSPKYSMGKGLMSDYNYVGVTDPTLNGSPVRLFFNQNVNLSSPLDGFNPATSNGSNMTGSIARQYFTDYGFRYMTQYQSSPKAFGDMGGSFKKYKVFGGYGMGYSFIVDTLDIGSISWNNFSFVSVGSRCVQSAMNLGYSSFDGLTGCQNVGLLVLKGQTYANRTNNASVVVLSKNPANKGQILYEQFDCAEDDYSRIFNNDYCTSISHGYIVHNSTGNVLPFLETGSYTVSSNSNDFFNFMYGGNLYGYTSIDGSQYCLNGSSNSYCFSLHSTPNGASIKELYLQGSLGGGIITTTTSVYQDFFSSCMNDPAFYSLNRIACDGLTNSMGQPVELNGGNGLYTSYGLDSSGNVVQWITYQEDFQNTGFQFVEDSNGNGYYVCIDPRGCDDFFGSSGVISPGNLGNMDGLKSYFRDWFEGGFFFSCPFPYGFGEMEDVNIAGTKVFFSTIGRDFLYPLYCMGAGFKAGKNVEFFSGVNNVLNGRLFSSSDYSALYNLFDLILSLGILFLIIKIYHLLN